MKEIFKGSLNTKITVILIVFLVLGMGILAYFINNDVHQEVNKLSRDRNNETVLTLKTGINSFLNESANLLKVTANVDSVKNIREKELKTYFAEVLKVHPEIRSVYLGTEAGAMLDVPKDDLGDDYDPRERPWYQEAETANDVIWTDTYVDLGTGELIITAAKRVKNDQGQQVGVIAADISLKTVSDFIAGKKVGQNGYSFLINNQAQVIAHPQHQLIDEKYDMGQVLNFNQISNNKNSFLEYEHQGEEYLASYAYLPQLDSYVFAQVPMSEAYQANKSILKTIISYSLIIVILLVIVLAIFIKKNVVNPIKYYGEKMELVANGNLNVSLETDRNDELGTMAIIFNKMIKQLRNLVTNIMSTSEEVLETASHLEVSSKEVGETSEQVAISIQEVANGAEDQSRNVDQVSDKIKKFSSGLDNLSNTSNKVEGLSDEMNDVIIEGQQKMEKLNTQMDNIILSIRNVGEDIEELEGISNEIGSIIEIIDSIAEQTNLLALNAAIEAARAGSAGRGFSVVADEIRDLAEESSTSADKIKKLIDKVTKKTEVVGDEMEVSEKEISNGEDLVNSVNLTFDSVTDKISKVNAGMKKTASVIEANFEYSSEIAKNAENISDIAENTSASAQEVAAASEEQTASVEELSSISANLTEKASHLEELIAKFEI
ncbi:methyl-accepting chemotaxis protein [Halanaerobium praevalens]|uniref:Methyl-accepting chemotaxis sensory transducer with Cache sensor n=1 Tax=Halanaerobium praevalens (strain ATCC 33744 / DSM 2228 / GSL) TaxID=572479 RepID=E3DP36_HALPG|nr:methyl-accepting chemotaxis protein [Halanaerobium praevalens]ADO77669.1 methyl-accepting chemotaxis sensory transducer with Cache sensor [Halanaerobium praevalens DSM 2228]